MRFDKLWTSHEPQALRLCDCACRGEAASGSAQDDRSVYLSESYKKELAQPQNEEGAVSSIGIRSISIPGELLQQGVEVFQLGVFNDDSAAAVVVFDVNLQS